VAAKSTLKATRCAGMVRIDGQVEWSVAQNTETGVCVGIRRVLGVTPQTDSWSEMTEEIVAVQNMLFQDLCETGELDAFLHGQGWSVVGEPDKDAAFDLPFFIPPSQGDGCSSGVMSLRS